MTNAIEKQTNAEVPCQSRLQTIDQSPLPILLMPSDMPQNTLGEIHSHQRGQLIYPCNGRYCVHLDKRLLTGSAWQAIWIPPRIKHTVEAIDSLCVHNVYIDTEVITQLPLEPKIFKVSTLLSELLIEGAELAKKPHLSHEFQRLTEVIADQIRLAKSLDSLMLPLSVHPKIKRITETLLDSPSDPRCLSQWARLVHASPRNLSRLFIKETGLTFSDWRQRLYVKEAIGRLSEGHSVTRVSADLGYRNQSAFTQMFRRMTGRVPSDFKAATI